VRVSHWVNYREMLSRLDVLRFHRYSSITIYHQRDRRTTHDSPVSLTRRPLLMNQTVCLYTVYCTPSSAAVSIAAAVSAAGVYRVGRKSVATTFEGLRFRLTSSKRLKQFRWFFAHLNAVLFQTHLLIHQFIRQNGATWRKLITLVMLSANAKLSLV